jgi:hypothetical protein
VHKTQASEACTLQGAANECEADHPDIFLSKQSEGGLETFVESDPLSGITAKAEGESERDTSGNMHIEGTKQKAGLQECSRPEKEPDKGSIVESHDLKDNEVAEHGIGEHEVPTSDDSSTESSTLRHGARKTHSLEESITLLPAGKTGSLTESSTLPHAGEADSSAEACTLPNAGQTDSSTESTTLSHAGNMSTGSGIIRVGEHCMEVPDDAGVRQALNIPPLDKSLDKGRADPGRHRSREVDRGIVPAAPASKPADAEGLLPADPLDPQNCTSESQTGDAQDCTSESQALVSTSAGAEGITTCAVKAVDQSEGISKQSYGIAEQFEGNIKQSVDGAERSESSNKPVGESNDAHPTRNVAPCPAKLDQMEGLLASKAPQDHKEADKLFLELVEMMSMSSSPVQSSPEASAAPRSSLLANEDVGVHCKRVPWDATNSTPVCTQQQDPLKVANATGGAVLSTSQTLTISGTTDDRVADSTHACLVLAADNVHHHGQQMATTPQNALAELAWLPGSDPAATDPYCTAPRVMPDGYARESCQSVCTKNSANAAEQQRQPSGKQAALGGVGMDGSQPSADSEDARAAMAPTEQCSSESDAPAGRSACSRCSPDEDAVTSALAKHAAEADGCLPAGNAAGRRRTGASDAVGAPVAATSAANEVQCECSMARMGINTAKSDARNKTSPCEDEKDLSRGEKQPRDDAFAELVRLASRFSSPTHQGSPTSAAAPFMAKSIQDSKPACATSIPESRQNAELAPAAVDARNTTSSCGDEKDLSRGEKQPQYDPFAELVRLASCSNSPTHRVPAASAAAFSADESTQEGMTDKPARATSIPESRQNAEHAVAEAGRAAAGAELITPDTLAEPLHLKLRDRKHSAESIIPPDATAKRGCDASGAEQACMHQKSHAAADTSGLADLQHFVERAVASSQRDSQPIETKLGLGIEAQAEFGADSARTWQTPFHFLVTPDGLDKLQNHLRCLESDVNSNVPTVAIETVMQAAVQDLRGKACDALDIGCVCPS